MRHPNLCSPTYGNNLQKSVEERITKAPTIYPTPPIEKLTMFVLAPILAELERLTEEVERLKHPVSDKKD